MKCILLNAYKIPKGILTNMVNREFFIDIYLLRNAAFLSGYKIMIHIDLMDVHDLLLLLGNCAQFTRLALPLFCFSCYSILVMFSKVLCFSPAYLLF